MSSCLISLITRISNFKQEIYGTRGGSIRLKKEPVPELYTFRLDLQGKEVARRTAGNRTNPSGSETRNLESTDIQPQPTAQGGLVRVALSSRRTERFVDFFARSFFGGKPSRVSQQTPGYPFS